jgi:hypothetical protein
LYATLERTKDDKPDAKQETRLEGQRRMWRPDPEWMEMVSQQTYETLRDQWMPELPPIDGWEYLVAYLFEIGPILSSGMGHYHLTFGELDSWCKRTGIDLEAFEARWLIRLSKEYLGENQKAVKHFAPAPWTPDDGERGV